MKIFLATEAIGFPGHQEEHPHAVAGGRPCGYYSPPASVRHAKHSQNLRHPPTRLLSAHGFSRAVNGSASLNGRKEHRSRGAGCHRGITAEARRTQTKGPEGRPGEKFFAPTNAGGPARFPTGILET
jgi:hypothetical protein